MAISGVIDLDFAGGGHARGAGANVE